MFRRSERFLVYSVFVDDSERVDGVQVIGAAIVPSYCFRQIHEQFGWIVQERLKDFPSVGSDPKFEFHASAIWNTNDAWKGIPKEYSADILDQAVHAFKIIGRPCMTYGFVRTNGPYDKEAVIDSAFRRCCYSVADWFRQYGPEDFGSMVYDEPKNGRLKDRLLETFHNLRPITRTSPVSYGILECIPDEMSFADSRGSLGLQPADLGSWLIGKSLSASASSRVLQIYRELEPLIHHPSDSVQGQWDM